MQSALDTSSLGCEHPVDLWHLSDIPVGKAQFSGQKGAPQGWDPGDAWGWGRGFLPPCFTQGLLDKWPCVHSIKPSIPNVYRVEWGGGGEVPRLQE